MTRAENSSERSLAFSRWLRRNAPDSETGQCIGNLDWMFWNYKTKRLFIAEEKCFKARLKPWFKRFMTETFSPALESFCKANGIKFGGFYVIQFENTCPTDGKMWINGKPSSPEKFLELFNVEKKFA